MTAVFSRIYADNAWNGAESRSGPGSGPVATERVVDELLSLVDELRITSVVDVACGDGYWMPDLPGYRGFDVAPAAIALARAAHPERDYQVADVSQGCPAADLVIVRDAIQHLSPSEGLALLDAIRRSGSRWLLASTFVGGDNRAIETGDAYSPDLEAAPFGLPGAVRYLRDGYSYTDPGQVRDPRKMLGLWPL